jgi:DNA-binding LytR/AlgR family response regulator
MFVLLINICNFTNKASILNPITCIIVEDNLNDYKLLNYYVQQQTVLQCKGYFENAIAASEFLRSNSVDLMFMDIDMPVISGMDFFKQLTNAPVCIFVTSHSEYAWEGFEAQAFDFILKPVKPDRLVQTITRLQEYFDVKKRADLYDSQIDETTITIKEGTSKHIVPINEILYIEALKDYSKVVTTTKKIMTLSKLKHFLDKLPTSQFARIHRSYAVALQKVSKIETTDLFIENIKLPIGKTFKQLLNLSL